MMLDEPYVTAAIMWINEEGVIQSEFRNYPQGHKRAGRVIDNEMDMRPHAEKFRADNPNVRVWIRCVATTDYPL